MKTAKNNENNDLIKKTKAFQQDASLGGGGRAGGTMSDVQGA